MNKKTILKVKDKADSYYSKMDLFDLPMRLLVNGKSQLSGKTNFILNLLLRSTFYRSSFSGENIFIVSNNKLDNKYKILMTEKDIPSENYMPYNEEELEILYEQLEDEFLEEIDEGKKPSNKIIIFDDVAYGSHLKKTQGGIISKMIMNGRHLNLSSIYCSQKYSLLGTNIRTNVTGAVLFNTSQKELELIADDFNYLEKKKDFIKMFRDNTAEKHSFMVVNFTADNRNEMYLNNKFEPINP